MLDAVMRLAAGFGAYAPDAPPVALGRGARGEVGRLEKLDPWAPEVGDAGARWIWGVCAGFWVARRMCAWVRVVCAQGVIL